MRVTNEIARRYSTAFFESSNSAGISKQCLEDINILYELILSDSKSFEFLFSQMIDSSVKRKIVEKVFKNKVTPLTFRFLNLLIEKNRISALPDICGEFIKLKNIEAGFTHANFYSVQMPDDHDKSLIQKNLEQRFSKKFLIKYFKDSSLIAGFRFIFNDTLFDCSVATMLETLRKQLTAGMEKTTHA